MKKYRFLLLFVLTNLLWGFAFPAIKDLTNAGTPVFFLLSGRFLLGAAILAAIRVALSGGRKFSGRALWSGALVGTALFFAFALQTGGMTRTTPSKIGMLSGTSVLFVPLFLAAIERKIRLRSVVDATLCVVGFCFFFEVYRDAASFNWGDAMALGTGATLGAHFLLTDRFAHKSDPIDFTVAQLGTVAVWTVVCCVAFESNRIDWSIVAKPRYFGELAFLGIVSTGLAYWSQILAQKTFSASAVSAVACLQSVFATIFSILLGFDVVSFGVVVGGALVVWATVRAATAPTAEKSSRLSDEKSSENATAAPSVKRNKRKSTRAEKIVKRSRKSFIGARIEGKAPRFRRNDDGAAPNGRTALTSPRRLYTTDR